MLLVYITMTLQQAAILDINLVKGLNLITLPVDPVSNQTASGLLSAVNSSQEVFSYTVGNWGPEVLVDADTGQLVGEDFAGEI